MPKYDFTCLACHHTFEQRVPVSDRDQPLPCELCQGEAQRQFDPTAINFNLACNPDSIHKGTSFEISNRERDLLSIDPALHNDVTHTPNYHLGQKRDRRQQKVNEFFARKKSRKTIKDRMLEKWPEMHKDLDKPIGKGTAEYLRKSVGLQ